MCDRKHPDELADDDKARVADFEASSGLGILEVNVMDDGKIVPTLINGKGVDRSEWKEVVRIGGRSCTGTIVGKNCAITAAHCGGNNSRSYLEIHDVGRIDYRVIHMPQYRGQSNFDLAVLVFDSETDIKPARVGTDYQFAQGADVDILGYGCTRPGGSGGNDGILRFGESKVAGFTGTDVITQWRPGGAALCFGDSGGPMMADKSDESSSDVNTLIAVNSKGNIRDTNYNMRLDLESVRDFLRSTADRYDLEMWGVNYEPDPGTDPDPDPPEPNPPADSDIKAIYANTAKDYRSQIAFYEGLATKYVGLAAINGGEIDNPSNEGSGLLFTLN